MEPAVLIEHILKHYELPLFAVMNVSACDACLRAVPLRVPLVPISADRSKEVKNPMAHERHTPTTEVEGVTRGRSWKKAQAQREPFS